MIYKDEEFIMVEKSNVQDNVLGKSTQTVTTGFPKKRRPFLKIENIPNLLTDDKKGKIVENIK